MSLTPLQYNTLLESFLFANVDLSSIEPLLEELEPQTFGKGEIVYSAQHFSRSIGIILSGRLEVLKRDVVVLNTLRVGDCFGAAAVFQPAKRYVTTIKAKTNATIAFFTDQQLQDLFLQVPQISLNYIAFLSERIVFLNRKIDGFTASSSEEAVAMFLLDNLRDNRVLVYMGYTQLARQLGMGRASLYRCLEKMEEQGVVHRVERVVTVLDRSALEAYRTSAK